MSKKVTDQNFDKEVLKSEKLVLADFWADWCNPCKALEPIIEKLEENYEDKVKFVKVNVDKNKQLASRYNVNGIPALFLFKDGEVVNEIVGVKPYDKLEEVIKKAL